MRPVSFLMQAAVALLALFSAAAARAAELQVVASPSLAGVFAAVGPSFERDTGVTLALHYGLVAAQKEQIETHDIDVAIAPSAVVDEEIRRGRISTASGTPIARVGLAVGVRAGAAKPEVTSVDAFKRTMLEAKSVAYVADEPGTGEQIAKDFERLGIADVMKAKTRSEPTVARVWQAVASGEAELGFGFSANAAAAAGVELAGSFPPELQYYTTLVAAIGAAAREPNAAKALIQYLLKPEAMKVMQAKALEPASR